MYLVYRQIHLKTAAENAIEEADSLLLRGVSARRTYTGSVLSRECSRQELNLHGVLTPRASQTRAYAIPPRKQVAREVKGASGDASPLLPA